MHLTTQQLKAARALLNWTQEDLAEASKVSLPTVQRLESKPGPIRGTTATMAQFVDALEKNGIELIGPKAGRVGVVLVDDKNNEAPAASTD